MEDNEILREQLLEVVENQIRSNEPPETALTYERLISMGYSESDSQILIAQCLAVEMYLIMKHQKPFDEKRYTKNLENLPNEPTE